MFDSCQDRAEELWSLYFDNPTSWMDVQEETDGAVAFCRKLNDAQRRMKQTGGV